MLPFPWTLRSKYGRISYFYSLYTIFSLFFSSNFNSSTRSNKWQNHLTLNFTMYSSQKLWNVQSQNKWIPPTQRIGKDVKRTKPMGEDNPAGRSCLIRARTGSPWLRPRTSPAPGRQLVANSPWPEQAPPFAPSWGRATQQRLLEFRTIAPHRTRTRPLFPCFPHKNKPRSSGILPTPGPMHWCFVITRVIPHEGSPTI